MGKDDDDLLLIFDGNNLCMRSFFAMDAAGRKGGMLTTSDGRESGTLYGMVNTFFSFIRKYRPTHCLFIFDYGMSEFRHTMRSSYKGNRHVENKVDMTAYYSNFDKFLSLVGVRSYRQSAVEADDLIACAVRDFKDIPILILSADHDLQQLISRRVTVTAPSLKGRSAEKIFTVDWVRRTHGLPPHRLPELWAITGDASDNIKGLKGIGPVKGAAMLAGTNLQSLIATHPAMEGNEKLIWENYQMICLPCPDAILNVTLEECRFDPEAADTLEKFLTEWEFSSLLARYHSGMLWRDIA